MRLSLYISEKLADLGSGESEALLRWTYTRDDADAPAAVKNAYTKTVTLPATDANSAIFSHLGALDRVTIAGIFDPLTRLPFKVYDELGQIIDNGYLKVDKIARRGETVLSYDVTLYGGMGSFFYALAYKSDGSKRTLADMRWLEDTIFATPSHLADPYDIVTPYPTEAWAELINGTYIEKPSGIINFVPANNGIPDEQSFNCKQAYYKPGTYNRDKLDGLSTSVVVDGVTYTPRLTDNGGIIVNLGSKLTEWEVQCLPVTMQRCAFNLRRLFRSIEACSKDGDFGGWTLELDSEFFENDNPYWTQTWVTLEATRKAGQAHIIELLRSTKSPLDYLLGYAKTFGLVFVVDIRRREVHLKTRNEYYNTQRETVDLSDRIEGDVTVRPFFVEARTYTFGVPVEGAFASSYESGTGRKYGDFVVNSGFSFDASAIEVMKSSPFAGCVDVLESSPWYFTKPDTVSTAAPMGNYIKFVEYNEVSYLLYTDGGSRSTKVVVPAVGGRRPYNGTSYDGVAALPQFHDKDGKRLKAPDVMLFLCGKITLPDGTSSNPVNWHVGHYLTDAGIIYDISPTVGVTPITELPLFRRSIDSRGLGALPPVGSGTIGLDFGDPLEIATGEGDIPEGEIYPDYWKKYIEDRFDRDALVMEARVDLSGLDTCQELLRRFFWYRGSIWSLNKISDYNPARPGVTKCEFIRVKDTANYTAGQRLPIVYQ